MNITSLTIIFLSFILLPSAHGIDVDNCKYYEVDVLYEKGYSGPEHDRFYEMDRIKYQIIGTINVSNKESLISGTSILTISGALIENNKLIIPDGTEVTVNNSNFKVIAV